MTFDLDKIFESKRAMRKRLASLPIGEKLRMLDALRERTLAIRGKRRTETLRSRTGDSRQAPGTRHPTPPFEEKAGQSAVNRV